jgi:hypothetical protein
LNARDQVVFDAGLTGPSISGVFVGDGTTTSTIALGGNPDPAAGNFGSVSNAFFFTPNGDVVFDVDFNDVFTSNGSTIAPLVRNGDQAPGGGTVTQIDDHNANGHGVLAYKALLSSATPPRESSALTGQTRSPSLAMTALHRRAARTRCSPVLSSTIAGSWRSRPR